MVGVDWMGLALPFAYLLVLSGALMSFSTIYRKRKAAESANLAPWFGPNLQRDIYLSLLHLGPDGSSSSSDNDNNKSSSSGKEKEKAAPRVPDSVLRAALLRRAVQDIERLIQIKSAKQACSNLLLRGSVGDDLWQRFQRAEREMESELRDVVTEANALAPNWGPTIFQSAHEITANQRLRQRLDDIQSQSSAEKQWWEKRRAQIQTDFMRELDDSEKSSSAKATSTSEDDAVLIDTPGRTAGAHAASGSDSGNAGSGAGTGTGTGTGSSGAGGGGGSSGGGGGKKGKK